MNIPEMTDAKQVPLIELLRGVPATARLKIDDGEFSTQYIPVGRYCHEAAAILAARDAQWNEALAAQRVLAEGAVPDDRQIAIAMMAVDDPLAWGKLGAESGKTMIKQFVAALVNGMHPSPVAPPAPPQPAQPVSMPLNSKQAQELIDANQGLYYDGEFWTVGKDLMKRLSDAQPWPMEEQPDGTVIPVDPSELQQSPEPSKPAQAEAPRNDAADAHLKALLRYTEAFYSSAMAHGMKAGPVADSVAHVERAAKALHALATLPPAIAAGDSGAGERHAFEAYIAKDCGDLSTFGVPPNRHYKNSGVNHEWMGWQARAALIKKEKS